MEGNVLYDHSACVLTTVNLTIYMSAAANNNFTPVKHVPYKQYRRSAILLSNNINNSWLVILQLIIQHTDDAVDKVCMKLNNQFDLRAGHALQTFA